MADGLAGQVGRAAVEASVQGWVNHARHGNTLGLRKALFNAILTYPRPGR